MIPYRARPHEIEAFDYEHEFKEKIESSNYFEELRNVIEEIIQLYIEGINIQFSQFSDGALGSSKVHVIIIEPTNIDTTTSYVAHVITEEVIVFAPIITARDRRISMPMLAVFCDDFPSLKDLENIEILINPSRKNIEVEVRKKCGYSYGFHSNLLLCNPNFKGRAYVLLGVSLKDVSNMIKLNPCEIGIMTMAELIKALASNCRSQGYENLEQCINVIVGNEFTTLRVSKDVSDGINRMRVYAVSLRDPQLAMTALHRPLSLTFNSNTEVCLDIMCKRRIATRELAPGMLRDIIAKAQKYKEVLEEILKELQLESEESHESDELVFEDEIEFEDKIEDT